MAVRVSGANDRAADGKYVNTTKRKNVTNITYSPWVGARYADASEYIFASRMERRRCLLGDSGIAQPHKIVSLRQWECTQLLREYCGEREERGREKGCVRGRQNAQEKCAR